MQQNYYGYFEEIKVSMHMHISYFVDLNTLNDIKHCFASFLTIRLKSQDFYPPYLRLHSHLVTWEEYQVSKVSMHHFKLHIKLIIQVVHCTYHFRQDIEPKLYLFRLDILNDNVEWQELYQKVDTNFVKVIIRHSILDIQHHQTVNPR